MTTSQKLSCPYAVYTVFHLIFFMYSPSFFFFNFIHSFTVTSKWTMTSILFSLKVDAPIPSDTHQFIALYNLCCTTTASEDCYFNYEDLMKYYHF